VAIIATVIIPIAGLWVLRVGVIAAAHLDIGVAGLRRFFGTEGAVPDIARWALVIGIRGRGFVRVLLAARTAWVHMSIFGTLKTVALVLKGLVDAWRLATFINVHIADNVLECVHTRSRANRAWRRDIFRVADRILAFVLVKDGDLVRGFAGVGLRRYAFAGCSVVLSRQGAAITGPNNVRGSGGSRIAVPIM